MCCLLARAFRPLTYLVQQGPVQCGAAGHIAVQLFMCLSMPFDLQLKARSAAAEKLPQSEAACMLWFKYACCSRGLPLQPWPCAEFT